MDLLLHSASHLSTARYIHRRHLHLTSLTPRRKGFFPVRSSLPFQTHEAKYHRELEAAIKVVERACRLCVDVKRSLFSSEGRIVEKNDQTPVTIADFGVQALVSLELGKVFPSIPLVAEEDSSFVRSNNLVDSVVSVVTDKANSNDKPLKHADVLAAIDRGGKNPIVFGTNPATYWVGLALVVEGEIVLGVMGCPNWTEDNSYKSTTKIENMLSGPGTLMVAHVGCGTWTKELPDMLGRSTKVLDGWTRCIVDGHNLVPEARFCISDSQTWESLPLSDLFDATSEADSVGDKEILLLPTCCGSLCKYLMVASGRASVFILRSTTQRTIKAWDHAVGIICVHEAGGKVTDWKGNQLDFAADQVERRIIFPSGGVLVTNGKLHNQIVEMIASSSAVG
ncbi:putative PAP-specific phosphatase, mitochondrial isoform X4 [Ricinus communis]|uniref:putative PAP-specific phosphatase, mitochondrial isoform X4 n=1 Tax=Ricinus communis TaxID=3988 RepID=UPI000772D107|nr:putative PAP-specific phosphatase, mitochondrial isoform X4 [Ricinus communis]|eukprot:XP_015578182.1 putative PAP-specific phosphatase, mitochondrial isoform X2 [Ricinus communis]